jgi:FlaA1/EpsC-like NDP-sugar epimerase
MHYYRIAVKVVPELDPWILRKTAEELDIPLILPNGIVTEETIIVVAPKTKGKGFIKAYKQNKRTFVTCFIHHSPEIAWKRILCVIVNFIEKRLKALLNKMKIQPYMVDHLPLERLHESLLYNIIENYSFLLRRVVESFSHGLCWLKRKLKECLMEIGRQNMVKARIVERSIGELTSLIKDFKRVPEALKATPDPPIINKLAEVLLIEGG